MWELKSECGREEKEEKSEEKNRITNLVSLAFFTSAAIVVGKVTPATNTTTDADAGADAEANADDFFPHFCCAAQQWPHTSEVFDNEQTTQTEIILLHGNGSIDRRDT